MPKQEETGSLVDELAQKCHMYEAKLEDIEQYLTRFIIYMDEARQFLTDSGFCSMYCRGQRNEDNPLFSAICELYGCHSELLNILRSFKDRFIESSLILTQHIDGDIWETEEGKEVIKAIKTANQYLPKGWLNEYDYKNDHFDLICRYHVYILEELAISFGHCGKFASYVQRNIVRQRETMETIMEKRSEIELEAELMKMPRCWISDFYIIQRLEGFFYDFYHHSKSIEDILQISIHKLKDLLSQSEISYVGTIGKIIQILYGCPTTIKIQELVTLKNYSVEIIDYE